MSWSTELYTVELRLPKGLEYSKNINLEEIRKYLEIRLRNVSYEDYIKPGLIVFGEDLNALARELSVDRISPMGLYIRGVYGGEEKRGGERYAGLVLEEYHLNNVAFEFKLYGIKEALVAPLKLLGEYGIRVYRMVYVGEVNPFRIVKYLDIMLSQRGAESLKEFLRKTLKLNERSISVEAYRRMEKLISELQQPSTIPTLDTSMYYVVYRTDRIFSACALKPIYDNIIIYSNVGLIECKSEDVAYYYAAALNYLAFCAIRSKRAFFRHQYRKSPIALYAAGLTWDSMDDRTRNRIVELSKKLHEKVPPKEYSSQRMAFKALESLPEFKELVGILDSKVEKERLEQALNIVCRKGVEEE